MKENKTCADSRKAQLADALVAIYDPVSEIVSDAKDDGERAKFQHIQRKSRLVPFSYFDVIGALH